MWRNILCYSASWHGSGGSSTRTYQNSVGPVQPLLWGLEGSRCVFPLIFQKRGFWGIWGTPDFWGTPEIWSCKIPIFFGLKKAKKPPQFFGVPRKSGIFLGLGTASRIFQYFLCVFAQVLDTSCLWRSHTHIQYIWTSIQSRWSI